MLADNELPTIPLHHLAFAFLPVLVVLAILWRWALNPWSSVIAVARMLGQLLLIGYVLITIFETNQPAIVGLVLLIMLIAASWISLRGANDRTLPHFGKSFMAIASGGVSTLLLITLGVLTLDPWFEPRYVIPLAGMIFANSMNTVSLASERFLAETSREVTYTQARQVAMRAALIPPTNALLAVGLVSIPGMMTGQVLAGVDPLIAARYQIMVMAMIFGSAGISAGCYLVLMRPVKQGEEQ